MTSRSSNSVGLLRLLVGLGLVLTLLVPGELIAHAGLKSCKVRNGKKTYQGSGSNLQKAIDAAKSGATLRITGVCVGNYSVSKNVTLSGHATKAKPIPTLDGNDAGMILLLVGTPDVQLLNLTLTHGGGTTGVGASSIRTAPWY